MKLYYFITLHIIIIFVNCNKNNYQQANFRNTVVGEIGTFNYLILCNQNFDYKLIGNFYFEKDYFIFKNYYNDKTIIFDFSKKNKELYFFKQKLYYNKKIYISTYSIFLDTIYKFKNKIYYKFIIPNGSCFQGSKYDINFFLIKNKGIVGFYHSYKNMNETWISKHLIGNCLQNNIDYSQYKRLNLL